MKTQYVLYYVEGQDEEKLLNTLKSEMFTIKTGKVQILNVVEHQITKARLMGIRPGTLVVLVFDTDTGNVDILNKNIEALQNCASVSKIITIPQVRNLEEELVRSSNIRQIKELLNSKSNSEFKEDIIKVTNLKSKLIENRFNIDCFWTANPGAPYQHIANGAQEVKLRKDP